MIDEEEAVQLNHTVESTMSWFAVAKSFHVPAIDVSALRSRAQLAAGFGCISVAGATLGRSSTFRSQPFACLGISTDASKLLLLNSVLLCCTLSMNKSYL